MISQTGIPDENCVGWPDEGELPARRLSTITYAAATCSPSCTANRPSTPLAGLPPRASHLWPGLIEAFGPHWPNSAGALAGTWTLPAAFARRGLGRE